MQGLFLHVRCRGCVCVCVMYNMHIVWCICVHPIVLCPDYFYAEGKNSLVNCLFNFCCVQFKNWWRNVFKNVLCEVTQSMKLQKCSKEMACCRNHPSRSFWMLRNEDSQNMKPLSTSESSETILSTFEAQELHTASFQAQKNTSTIHRSAGILSLVVLWFYLA